MDNLRLAFEGAWHVLVAGLVLGAGLPAVFALGVRALGPGRVGAGGAGVARRIVAAMCFAFVVGGVVLGLTFIVASGQGKKLSFEHVVPTFVDK